jgi:hypothetical protein
MKAVSSEKRLANNLGGFDSHTRRANTIIRKQIFNTYAPFVWREVSAPKVRWLSYILQ